MTRPAWWNAEPDEWLRHVVGIHFDPQHGSSYWLERQAALGLDARAAIRTRDDLPKLGPMPEDDLARRPLTDLLPRPLLERRHEWVVAETGGTLGVPKTTLYREEDLRHVFVDPFTEVARAHGFPEGVPWLFAGPTGPHVIGKAARENARALGSAEPFAIDFDPRWAKCLAPGSLARRRYLGHVIEQALRIVRVQGARVLFTTPVVLEALAAELDEAERQRIAGVFYGGMAISPEQYHYFRDQAFPAAVHLAGYGNTLMGLALQVAPSADGHFDYFYPGARLHVRLVERDEVNAPSAERLVREVGVGETGQVVVSRLDEAFLIVNLFERDQAERLPSSSAAPWPVRNPGLRDPRPLEALSSGLERQPVAAGFY